MAFHPKNRNRSRRRESGYILLTLMLFVALMVIAAVVIVPTVTFQAKRDREEELIHRGVQYSRAIRRYVKKLGRYPTRIEDLESTNNMRFLRKRYKDPLTGKDFKLLHLGEVKMIGGVGLTGATQPGAAGLAGNTAALAGILQQAQGMAAAGGLASAGLNAGSLNAGGLTSGGTTSGQASAKQPASGADADTDKDADDKDAEDKPQPGFSGPTFGGGPIVGVASASKDKTIRVFDKQDHYNKWQFIYDPGTDRGGLLTTPTQAPLQNAGQNGQPGTPGTSGGTQSLPKPQPQQPQSQPPTGDQPE